MIATLSPALTPCAAAHPPFTSSTAEAGLLDGRGMSVNGVARSTTSSHDVSSILTRLVDAAKGDVAGSTATVRRKAIPQREEFVRKAKRLWWHRSLPGR